MPEGVSVSPENVVEPPPVLQAANTRAVPAPFPCTHWLAVIAAGVSVRPVKVDDPPPPPPAAQLRPVAVLVKYMPGRSRRRHKLIAAWQLRVPCNAARDSGVSDRPG